MNYEEALRNCIFKYISGSNQYGTNRPDSDIDYRGVFIAPHNEAFDIFKSSFVGSGTLSDTLKSALESLDLEDYDKARRFLVSSLQPDRGDLSIGCETVTKPGNDDELQELRKFFKLAADCNPNIIEFLYVDDLIEIQTKEWNLIKSKRDLFLSKKARWTFAGYAIQQLQRIRVHRGYILNPITRQPTRKEFGLSENSKIPREHQNAILALPLEWLAPNSREMVLQEKKYDEALKGWTSYKKWEKERNPARKELERKHGYDTKHSMHLVRLCRMAEEILRDGVVLVKRPDAEDLKGILRGEWKYEDIECVADGLDARLDSLYKQSTLREKSDRAGIGTLYKQICSDRYGIEIK